MLRPPPTGVPPPWNITLSFQATTLATGLIFQPVSIRHAYPPHSLMFLLFILMFENFASNSGAAETTS